MPEEPDDALDRLFHAEEIRELGVDLDRAVHENAPETTVLAGIDHDRLADRPQQPLRGAGVVGRIVGAFAEIFVERELDVAPGVVQPRVPAKDVVFKSLVAPQFDARTRLNSSPPPRERERWGRLLTAEFRPP